MKTPKEWERDPPPFAEIHKFLEDQQAAEAREAGIDYKALLIEYMLLVEGCEGTDFVGHIDSLGEFTGEQAQELRRLSRHNHEAQRLQVEMQNEALGFGKTDQSVSKER